MFLTTTVQADLLEQVTVDDMWQVVLRDTDKVAELSEWTVT